MNSKTVSQLKTELLARKGSILNLQTQNKRVEGEQEPSKDVVDRSEMEETWSNKERMSQHWKVELQQVITALQRIDAGSFGICEECSDEIPVKRLRVRPDAALCLNCQESMERELGPMRGIRTDSSSVNLLQ